MLQRVLIIYIAGILLCDFLLGLGPWREGRLQGQGAFVSSQSPSIPNSIAPSFPRSRVPEFPNSRDSEFPNSWISALLAQSRVKPETAALAQGVLLGDKHLISVEQKQAMREAGMSHLLAVSGLHIGIIWALLSLLLRPLVLLDSRGWHKGLILLLLWGYIAVVGFPASAVRAGVMISMIQFSWFLKRDVWGWHNLYTAALLILLFQPSQIYEAGFQLSFLATAGILAAGPWLQEGNWVRRLLLLTLSAQFFAFPLVIYYFHRVPLFCWVQGFLVLPIMALFVYLLILLLLFTAIGIPLLPLAWCADVMAWWMNLVAHYTTKIEEYCLGGKWEWHPNLLQTILLLLFLIVIACLAYRGKSKNLNS